MKSILFTCALLGSFWCLPRGSLALDREALATDVQVSRTVTEAFKARREDCNDSSMPTFLTLENMIERVLCHDPLTRQRWASARAQAAMVRVRQSAYLPRLDATLGSNSGRSDTAYKQRNDAVGGRQRRFERRLNLSWVLFDFGRRDSGLLHAHNLLVAANAHYDRHLQEAFAGAAQLYYQALAARHNLLVARQVTALATQNVNVANARYEAGAAALSDRLQAQTAHSRAQLNEVRAEGALRSVKGVIALQTGLPAQVELELVGDLSRRVGMDFFDSLDDLLEQALQQHPSLVAARANVNAAKADIDERRAAGRPVLSLTANLSDVKTRQPMALNGDSHARNNSVGLQLSIALFDGFENTHHVRRAQAHLAATEAQLLDEERRLSLTLWSTYQALKVESLALQNTAQWVEQSRQTLSVVQGRYRAGVGSMIESLDALTAYAAAEQQHINTLNAWQETRLKLAASLGTLGFWTL